VKIGILFYKDLSSALGRAVDTAQANTYLFAKINGFNTNHISEILACDTQTDRQRGPFL